MTGKENKGGFLTNEQVEKDNEVKGKNTTQSSYQGSQDTGDGGKRELGTEVQKEDGNPPDAVQDSGES